jgi:hypothetical protein
MASPLDQPAQLLQVLYRLAKGPVTSINAYTIDALLDSGAAFFQFVSSHLRSCGGIIHEFPVQVEYLTPTNQTFRPLSLVTCKLRQTSKFHSFVVQGLAHPVTLRAVFLGESGLIGLVNEYGVRAVRFYV